MNEPSIINRVPVLYDKAEKKPWLLDATYFEMTRTHLKGMADYTMPGFEDKIVLERKSLGDFVGSVIHNWIRFRKEMNRLGCCDLAAIVVEATVDDVLEHRYDSLTEPSSILGKAQTIYLDHGVPVFWWGQRGQCVRMVEQFFKLAWHKYGG